MGGKASALDLSNALVWEHRVIKATAEAEIQVDQGVHVPIPVPITANIDQLKPSPRHGSRRLLIRLQNN